jgi:hypothetical protein
MNSLSSLACSAHLIASLAAEHISHLLKPRTATYHQGETKANIIFRLIFALQARAA